MPAFAKYVAGEALTVTNGLSKRMISLPMSNSLTGSQAAELVQLLEEAVA